VSLFRTIIMPLLSEQELANLRVWKYSVDDRSITTKLLDPFWSWIVTLVPLDVAPNVLSVAGLFCLIHAFYVTFLYLDDYPTATPLGAAFLIFAYQTLDAIDGKQARRTKAASQLGELMDHACDNVGVVFLVLTMGMIMGVSDSLTLWFIVQIAQLVFLQSHLKALSKGAVSFGQLSGPGEVLVVCMGVACAYAALGPQGITDNLAAWSKGSWIAQFRLIDICTFLYYVALAMTVVLLLRMERRHRPTVAGLLLCFVFRIFRVAIVSHHLSLSEDEGLPIRTVLADGIFISLLCSDIIVAKIARRNLHPWIVLFCMVAVFDDMLMFVMTVLYYFSLFRSIAAYLKIPVFSVAPTVRVYIDGVYDMCHEGHVMQMRNALALGTQLVVGIMSDEDVVKYKRQPVMTLDERVRIVRALGIAVQIIPAAPATGLSEEFLRKHQIDVVAHSPEYLPENLKPGAPDYYGVPRQLGMTRLIPRTDGISTSELLARIIDRHRNGTL
jgi:choline-phosphate cytidylyltransferase